MAGLSPRMNRWQVGIVGCGRIAGALEQPSRSGPVRTHAQAYHRHHRFRLAACVNPTEESLKRFREKWKIPRGYRQLAAMLEEEQLDVITLCSPSEFHASQGLEILASARRPRVLFLEKPVCLQPEEAPSLLRQAQACGVPVMVNHSRRFDPAHRTLRKRIRSGAFGELVQARCLYYGGWLNNGTHLVDTLRMLLPRQLDLVSSRWAGQGRGQDANLEVDLRAGPAPVEIRPFDENRYQLFELDLCFEQGRVRLLETGFQLWAQKVRVNGWGERVLSPLPGFPRKGLVSPLAQAAGAVAEILDGKSQASDWGADLPSALETMQLVWKAQALAQRLMQPELTHAV